MPERQNPNFGDLSFFQIQSRDEILSILSAIKKADQVLNLVVEDGKESVITSILDIDRTNNRLIIDSAPSTVANHRIVESGNMSFECAMENVGILFFASRAEPCVHENLPALRIEIPLTMIRLQRRASFRVSVPSTGQLQCEVDIPLDEAGKTLLAKLLNVSRGGIALIDERRVLDNTVGRIYKHCRIYLPGKTMIETTLQIRNSKELQLPNGESGRCLGCSFIDLPSSMLTALQRYITKLEIEQNTRSSRRKD